jgi:hypothetical protein
MGPRPFRHVGRLNVEAVLPRLRATWPAPARVVVAGTSAGCAADLSLMYPALTTRHPQDRMALLTSLQDEVVAAFFLISLAADMELRTRALIADRIAPSAAFRAFVIPGTSHGLLGTADTITSGGMTLETWLSRMVDGDPTWATVGL